MLDSIFSPDNQVVVYQGLVDDPRNTDNAWIETVAVHVHIPDHLRDALPLQGGDDAMHAKWLRCSDEDESFKTMFPAHKIMVVAAIKNFESYLQSVSHANSAKTNDQL
jgi:ADP-ribose pyrophosphatase